MGNNYCVHWNVRMSYFVITVSIMELFSNVRLHGPFLAIIFQQYEFLSLLLNNSKCMIILPKHIPQQVSRIHISAIAFQLPQSQKLYLGFSTDVRSPSRTSRAPRRIHSRTAHQVYA